MVRDLDLDSKLGRGHALPNTEKKSYKFIFIKIKGWNVMYISKIESNLR